MSQPEKDNATAAQDHDRREIDSRTISESEHILPRWVRKAVLWAGIFTAYSQFVSVALLSYYRYHNAWDFGRYYKQDGYLGESFLVLWLFSPGGSIGRNEEYPIPFTILVAMILASFGSAGLLAAAFAKRRWRFGKSLLMLGFIIGLAAAVFVTGVHVFDGANRLRWLNFANIDTPYEFFPMHGVLEFVGATLLPAALYSALSLWLLFQAIRGLGRASK